jgi:dTDP-4-amino-4,6-dideoxygalactose transaminase
MAEIRKAAGGRFVVEDASHAFGAVEEGGEATGACAHSDIAVFSFHPVKPVTTGEGGVAATNDGALARRLRAARNHGIERDAAEFVAAGPDDGAWYYEQQDLGFNYRLSELHAALGLSQLGKLPRFAERRRALAAEYDRMLAGQAHIRPLQSQPDFRRRSAHHLYLVEIDFQAIGTTRAAFMTALQAEGIWTQVHYIPVYRHPYYRRRLGEDFSAFANAEAYYARALTLPLHPGMSESDVARVTGAIRLLVRR